MISERQTGLFLLSCGFAAPGLEVPQPDVDNIYASGMSFFHNVANLHDAEAGTEPHIDSVTEIGLSVRERHKASPAASGSNQARGSWLALGADLSDDSVDGPAA